MNSATETFASRCCSIVGCADFTPFDRGEFVLSSAPPLCDRHRDLVVLTYGALYCSVAGCKNGAAAYYLFGLLVPLCSHHRGLLDRDLTGAQRPANHKCSIGCCDDDWVVAFRSAAPDDGIRICAAHLRHAIGPIKRALR